ncbi:MAG TPA: metal ABC transporter ATP-binding protein [Acidimicrobiales bacterium]
MTTRTSLDAPTDILNVNGVEVAIDGRVILRDVEFRIEAGEFTGLIGSNGSGKTTLFQVILGLRPTVAGTVSLHGEALARRNRSIGYVPQKVLFDPEMPLRARDLVALGVDGHRYGLRRRSRAVLADIDEMLSAVDANEFADRRVGELSGGEQQRVLIAHALISRPELLLLDEPLANLDPGSAQEIIGLLHRVATDNRVAVLLSAHEMNPLLPVMDRVVYVANGRVASGTTDEVVRSDVLSALYGHHVDVLRVHGRVLVVASSSDEHEHLVSEHPELVVE